MALIWDPRTMATGVEEIDVQHQELVGRVNGLFRLLHLGRGAEGLDEFIGFLGGYAAWHHRYGEERAKEEQGLANAADRVARAQLTTILDGYGQRMASEGPTMSLVVEIQQKVSDWVRTHIVRGEAPREPRARWEVA